MCLQVFWFITTRSICIRQLYQQPKLWGIVSAFYLSHLNQLSPGQGDVYKINFNAQEKDLQPITYTAEWCSRIARTTATREIKVVKVMKYEAYSNVNEQKQDTQFHLFPSIAPDIQGATLDVGYLINIK